LSSVAAASARTDTRDERRAAGRRRFATAEEGAAIERPRTAVRAPAVTTARADAAAVDMAADIDGEEGASRESEGRGGVARAGECDAERGDFG
jgi:hypothetical protein